MPSPLPSTNPPASNSTPSPGHQDGLTTHWLTHVPAPLFAVVMGVAGLGLAWRKAGHVLDMPKAVGEGILAFSAILFLAITALYGLKALRHVEEVKTEFANPIRVNFFPAFSISLLLLSVGALPHAPALSHGLWVTGAALHLVGTVYLMGRWFTQSHEISMINPAWFIPVVGNILVPIAGVPLGYGEVSWFFFSIGLIYWIVLFTIVFHRIVFHHPLATKFLPTLFILIAPPAVGYISYMALNGGVVDGFARILVYGALFLTMLNLSLFPKFLKVPFFVSWWAYTFPTAAVTIACLDASGRIGHGGMILMAGSLLGLATVLITLVFLRTILALLRGELFIPEGSIRRSH
ncbi:MAG: SLAC1 anion channel family protein [Rhodospirillum sp.]|nr:SLAC1 anion channel family protein [Rhodospirillum sp.]MCF8492086.1 SLAC1 anion channel family protein [Rhodospirillum sp.]MCF8502824.1 SLAC1 anion channel family protein [Rhodospirillum sp.]